MPRPSWPAEQLAALRDLLARLGNRPTLIARHLGASKNAVIGQLHRNVFRTPRPAYPPRTYQRKPRRQRPPATCGVCGLLLANSHHSRRYCLDCSAAVKAQSDARSRRRRRRRHKEPTP